MPKLTPEIAPQVIATCQTNAEETAGALGRGLDGQFVVRVGEAAEPLKAASLSGGALVFALTIGDEHALVLLPDASGLVPEWTRNPDPTGESKLSTLAQELSLLLLPEDLMADAFSAAWVDDLQAAVARAQPSEESLGLELEVARDESLGRMTLVWPVADAAAALGVSAGPAEEAVKEEAAPKESPAAAPVREPVKSQSKVLRWNPPPRDLRDLPPNAVSLLRVNVLVSANLAGKKVRLNDVVELGPGSIITFDKPCSDPLELTVGSRPVAHAEAVKVGERFGVRVLDMILPEEHFRPMLPPEQS